MGYFALSLLYASMIGRLWLDSKRWTQQPIVKSAVQSQSREERHKKKSAHDGHRVRAKIHGRDRYGPRRDTKAEANEDLRRMMSTPQCYGNYRKEGVPNEACRA